MIAILTSREEAKTLSAKIQGWNVANIQGYSAESWANENLSDADYDASYMNQTGTQWYVPVPDSYPNNLTLVEVLPEDWVEPEENKIRGFKCSYS